MADEPPEWAHRIDSAEHRLEEHERRIGELETDMTEIRTYLKEAPTKTDIAELRTYVGTMVNGLLRDALNSIPAWHAAMWGGFAALGAIVAVVVTFLR